MSRLQKKKGRKSNYLKSLSNDYYKEVKRRCLIRDNFKCKRCGSEINLELHHITYYIDGICIIGKELDYLKWCVIVNEIIHQKIHNDITDIWNPKNKNKQSVK